MIVDIIKIVLYFFSHTENHRDLKYIFVYFLFSFFLLKFVSNDNITNYITYTLQDYLELFLKLQVFPLIAPDMWVFIVCNWTELCKMKKVF